jgi:hypothetical protein
VLRVLLEPVVELPIEDVRGVVGRVLVARCRVELRSAVVVFLDARCRDRQTLTKGN